MLRIFACVFSLCMLSGTAATAHYLHHCEKTELAALGAALKGAHDISLTAAAAVGDTENYRRWFGPFSKSDAETVRASLKSVYSAIAMGRVRIICLNQIDQGCQGNYASAFADDNILINICPPFFDLPTMTSAAPGSEALENGTREGTLIHEISHFIRVAGTDDVWYSRTTCAAEAQTDPRAAIRNADSYQYFAEDSTFYPVLAADAPE